jgi:putative RecB family exonuclease
MAFDREQHPLPRALSPSRLLDFQACPRKYEYSAVRKIKQPATYATTKGRFAHAILERLFLLPKEERTIERARSFVEESLALVITDDVRVDINYDDALEAKLRAETDQILVTYFSMEDPTSVTVASVDGRDAVELEIKQDVKGAPLYGILDRLDRDEHGNLVIVDYKTGSFPRPDYETSAFANAALYVGLCEALLGETPVSVRLLYIAVGQPLERPTSAIFPDARTDAAARDWGRINAAYERGNFVPTPSVSSCRFCPAAYKDLCRAEGVNIPEPRRR